MTGAEGLLIVVGLASLGAVIWGAIDASSHPDWAWDRAGQSKVTWILLQVILLLLCGIVGAIFTIIYFASIRPQVVAAETGGGGPPYGAPPPYGSPPPGYGTPNPPSWGAPPPAPGGPASPPPEPPLPRDPFA